MTERDASQPAVCDNPAEDTPRLVFADWRDENGEPERAEFIRLQIGLSKLPGGEQRQKTWSREKELLKVHAEEWAEPLAEFASDFFGEPFEFRRGFVEMIGMDDKVFIDSAADLFARAPVREVWFAELKDYGALAKCRHLLGLTAST